MANETKLVVTVEQFPREAACRKCDLGEHCLVPFGGAWVCPEIRAKARAMEGR